MTKGEADEAFMRLAIAEALQNHGLTAPNPSVGCVLVSAGEVIAAAATAPGGRPHAEEQALVAAGDRALGSIAYVTLEPCGARSSSTASCSERLVAAGVARVVYACDDPSPLASGQGSARLRTAGIVVDAGLLADEAAVLYADWIKAQRNP